MHRTGWRGLVGPGFRQGRPFHPLIRETCPRWPVDTCPAARGACASLAKTRFVPRGGFSRSGCACPPEKNRLAKCRRGCSYDAEALLIRRPYLCSAAASRSSPVSGLPDAWHTASVPTRCRLAPKNLGSARHTRPGPAFDCLSGDVRWSDRLSGWKSKACR